MPLFRKRRDAEPAGDDPELTDVAWEELPPGVRAAIGTLPPGHRVYAVRYPGDAGPSEWMWTDEDGEPMDVIWLE